MNATAQRHRRATAAQDATLPSIKQAIALALAMAEARLRCLISVRCNDEHWSEADLDVDNATEIALVQILRMKELGLEHSHEFDAQWFMAAAALNLAEKAFSRKDCAYARVLAGAVDVFRVLAEAVEFAGAEDTGSTV